MKLLLNYVYILKYLLLCQLGWGPWSPGPAIVFLGYIPPLLSSPVLSSPLLSSHLLSCSILRAKIVCIYAWGRTLESWSSYCIFMWFFSHSSLSFLFMFCRWWECLSAYIICNVSWWSWPREKLGITICRPYNIMYLLLWSHYAPRSWSNDEWHDSEASFPLFSFKSVLASNFKFSNLGNGVLLCCIQRDTTRDLQLLGWG